MAKSNLHQWQSNSSPHSSSPASSGGTPPTSRTNASPGDRWRREIHPKICLYLPGGCRLGPLSAEAGGEWKREAGSPTQLCPPLGLVPPATQRQQCLGCRPASGAGPNPCWDGVTPRGCLISTQSQGFAVRGSTSLPLTASFANE